MLLITTVRTTRLVKTRVLTPVWQVLTQDPLTQMSNQVGLSSHRYLMLGCVIVGLSLVQKHTKERGPPRTSVLQILAIQQLPTPLLELLEMFAVIKRYEHHSSKEVTPGNSNDSETDKKPSPKPDIKEGFQVKESKSQETEINIQSSSSSSHQPILQRTMLRWTS